MPAPHPPHATLTAFARSPASSTRFAMRRGTGRAIVAALFGLAIRATSGRSKLLPNEQRLTGPELATGTVGSISERGRPCQRGKKSAP